jgi:predicted nucleotidyltransferase
MLFLYETEYAKMKIPQIDKLIFKKFHVKLAYLFGSQAKGNVASKSDFDIAVVFKEEPADPLALNEIASLTLELNKFFPGKLDIVSLHAASSLLKHEVISCSQSLYCEDETERINFEVSVIKEYIDDQYTRDIYYNALKERVAKGTF